MEVDYARKYGLRSLKESSVPMPFLLIPVRAGRDANLRSMAKAEEDFEERVNKAPIANLTKE